MEQNTSAVSWKTLCFSPIPAIPIDQKDEIHTKAITEWCIFKTEVMQSTCILT